MRSQFRTIGLLLLCAVSLLVSGTAAATRKSDEKRPLSQSQYDPDAKQIELFDGIEDESIDVKVILADSKKGNVFVENKTKEPLTVKLPPAVVAVQVLKQFGGGGFGQQGGGQQGGGQQGGGAQQGGGMMGGGMGGGGMMGGGGGGMFSIPPEQVVKVPYKGVCLEYGKPEPTPKMTYRLARVEDEIQKPEVQELLNLLRNPGIDQLAFQAAAWHLSSGLTWQQLASLPVKQLGGLPPKSYFSDAQIRLAQRLVTQALEEVRNRSDDAPTSPNEETSKVRSARVAR